MWKERKLQKIMEDDVIGCCEGACDPVAMPSLNRKTLLEIIVKNAPKSSIIYYNMARTSVSMIEITFRNF